MALNIVIVIVDRAIEILKVGKTIDINIYIYIYI